MNNKFSLFPWQENDYNKLLKLTSNLPSALILHGLPKIGKTQLAYLLSSYLLCINPINGFSCKKCNSCILFENENHPDFFILEPTSKVISVEDVRYLVEFVSLSNHISKLKIILIKETNLLNLSSSNALLKILEEAKSNVFFILISDNIDKILLTIRSRCINYKVSAPTSSNTFNYYKEQNEEFWVNFYKNSPLVKIEIDELQLNLLLNVLLKPSINNIYNAMHEYDGKKISFNFFIEFMYKWVSDIIHLHMTEELNYFQTYQEKIKPLIVRLDLKKAYYLLDNIIFLLNWQNHSLNFKLQIENILYKYQQVYTYGNNYT